MPSHTTPCAWSHRHLHRRRRGGRGPAGRLARDTRAPLLRTSSVTSAERAMTRNRSPSLEAPSDAIADHQPASNEIPRTSVGRYSTAGITSPATASQPRQPSPTDADEAGDRERDAPGEPR